MIFYEKLCYKSISHIKVNALACQIRGGEPDSKRIRKLFFGRCFLEPAWRMRYDFHFSNESSSNFILIFKRSKGVHAKNLGSGQLG